MTDNHTLGASAQVIGFLDFETGHGQPFREILHGLLHLDQFLQPGERNPHQIHAQGG